MDGRKGVAGSGGTEIGRGLIFPFFGQYLRPIADLGTQGGQLPNWTNMTARPYLIAPVDLAPEKVAGILTPLLAAVPVAALLIPRGGMNADAYGAMAAALVTIAQQHGCAVLVENDAELARALGADGVHVTGGTALLHGVIKALKPDYIVGAGGISSRHEAMEIGELEVDYLMFGPLSGAATDADRENAGWWAENFVVPSVFSDPSSDVPGPDDQGCEFVAIGEKILREPGLAEISMRDRFGLVDVGS